MDVDVPALLERRIAGEDDPRLWVGGISFHRRLDVDGVAEPVDGLEASGRILEVVRELVAETTGVLAGKHRRTLSMSSTTVLSTPSSPHHQLASRTPFSVARFLALDSSET